MHRPALFLSSLLTLTGLCSNTCLAQMSLLHANSGSCVDAANRATADGTFVQQWACGAQQLNQEWQLQAQGNGRYSIVNRNAPGEVLDVADRGTANGSTAAAPTSSGCPWRSPMASTNTGRCWQWPLPRRAGRLGRERGPPADL